MREQASGFQEPNIVAVTAPAAAITGGESPTEAEFNALRQNVADLTVAVNALIVALDDENITA
jgi:hypothetical protein